MRGCEPAISRAASHPVGHLAFPRRIFPWVYDEHRKADAVLLSTMIPSGINVMIVGALTAAVRQMSSDVVNRR
jgi:hypothetical protein